LSLPVEWCRFAALAMLILLVSSLQLVLPGREVS
jgi:hypothetical protein